MIDINVIQSYLSQYGWQFETTDSNDIVASFGTDTMQFLVVFQLEPPWLRISIPVYLLGLKSPISEQHTLELLRANFNTRLARFAIDEHNQVILCLEIYVAQGLEYPQFEIHLDSITFFAETLYPKLSSEAAAEVDEL